MSQTDLAIQENREVFTGNREEETGHPPLFPGNETEDLHNRWQKIQGEFVDDPRGAVQEADKLVSSVIGRLTEIFAGEREKMEREWPKGSEGTTEDLRQALRRYRALFDRLLAV
jgi:hypothetical protein